MVAAEGLKTKQASAAVLEAAAVQHYPALLTLVARGPVAKATLVELVGLQRGLHLEQVVAVALVLLVNQQ